MDSSALFNSALALINGKATAQLHQSILHHHPNRHQSTSVDKQQSMNPHASAFVPKKVDHAERRQRERDDLTQRIAEIKQQLRSENTELVRFHDRLNKQYKRLSDAIAANKEGEAHIISKMRAKYNEQSEKYYAKYGKFNDLTSELIAFQQKLHRLLIHPELTSPRPVADSAPVSNGGHGMNLRLKLDAIGFNVSSTTPPQSPYNALPPIMESDAEPTAWNDFDDEDDEEISSAITMNLPLSAHSSSECKIKQTLPSLNDLMDSAHSSLHSQEFKEEEEDKSPSPKAKSESECEFSLEMKMEVSAHIVDHFAFEDTINCMLENIPYTDIACICQEFEQFIHSEWQHKTCSTVELLLTLIIDHGVDNKPNFFGAKYSALCRAVLRCLYSKRFTSQCTVRLDLYDIVWSHCYDTFRKLQFGNDSDKFINIMIVIAELYNVQLLTCSHILDDIFATVLCPPSGALEDEICENDIEGIYEIFKRCSANLNVPVSMQKYWQILEKVKAMDKFQQGMARVPFMITQMAKLCGRKET